jgi:hypothetical protein
MSRTSENCNGSDVQIVEVDVELLLKLLVEDDLLLEVRHLWIACHEMCHLNLAAVVPQDVVLVELIQGMSNVLRIMTHVQFTRQLTHADIIIMSRCVAQTSVLKN